MNAIMELLRNETPLVSAAITAVTALLTGPVFSMDAAAVGSISAVVAIIFNFWVRFQVYSMKGAVHIATAAATEAVSTITKVNVGIAGNVTAKGAAVVAKAVENVLGDSEDAIKPPG